MIVRFSVFTDNPWGDGGARRSSQIGEILSKCGQDICFVDLPNDGGRLTGLVGMLRNRRVLVDTAMPLNHRLETMVTLGNDLDSLRRRFMQLPQGSLLLWESTHSRFAHIPFLAKYFGFKVIALPHNLESLVPETRSFSTGKSAPNWLSEEIRTLTACEMVYAISREDQWMLRLHGIEAGYLPYHPPSVVVEAMHKIRAERKSLPSGNDLVLIGTAANRPTYSGMVDRLRFFSRHPDCYDNLHVAGYGTERLREHLPSSANIILHGVVSNTQLYNLLVSARAAVIHQVPTSGALTRIPELLLAGVPVLANVDAARSYYGTPGINIYENDEHLIEILHNKLPPVPVPVQPEIFELSFLEKVRFYSGLVSGRR